jgi:hypothetical protein
MRRSSRTLSASAWERMAAICSSSFDKPLLHRGQPGGRLFGRRARVHQVLLDMELRLRKALGSVFSNQVADARQQDQEVEDREGGRRLLQVQANQQRPACCTAGE